MKGKEKSMSAKKAATKKTATKKPDSPKKAACACKKSEPKAAAARKKATTRVIAKFNAGWGNQLFIRGTGAGLDWNKGIPMQCMGEDEWFWEQHVPSGDITFKILVNDANWSQGDDFVVVAGDTIICHPCF